MYNWSTDTKKLSQNKDAFTIWQLEQKINYGLGSEKLKRGELEKYWRRLQIDPYRRQFLDLLLHEK
jgi:hypothetical protein